MVVLAVTDRVAATASRVDFGFGLFLGGLYWFLCVMNTDEMQGLERGDPLRGIFRAERGVEE